MGTYLTNFGGNSAKWKIFCESFVDGVRTYLHVNCVSACIVLRSVRGKWNIYSWVLGGRRDSNCWDYDGGTCAVVWDLAAT